jgi:hypothetical protein
MSQILAPDVYEGPPESLIQKTNSSSSILTRSTTSEYIPSVPSPFRLSIASLTDKEMLSAGMGWGDSRGPLWGVQQSHQNPLQLIDRQVLGRRCQPRKSPIGSDSVISRSTRFSAEDLLAELQKRFPCEETPWLGGRFSGFCQILVWKSIGRTYCRQQ